MAGGVTVLYEGLVGRGVIGALEVLACLVGLATCLKSGLEVLTVTFLEIVDFEELTLDTVGLDGTTLTEFVLGLGRVALAVVTLGLGGVFLAGAGCGFFGIAPWSDKGLRGFVLEGLMLVVAGVVGFFLLSVPVIVFLGLPRGVGFGVVGLEDFGFVALEVEGLEAGGFVGGTLVLSGAVTVSVLALVGGEAMPSWTVTGITVPSRVEAMVPRLGFIVWVGITYLTAEAAAATLLARLSPESFLAVSGRPCFGVAVVAVMFACRGKIGSKGGRLGLYVSASLHCFLMYLQ